MSKRAVMIGLAVGVGLATLHGATAEAGGLTYVNPPGMWWPYGSVHGCAEIKSVPNPDAITSQVQCDITLTRIETLCLNPNGFDVQPGVAGAKVVTSSKFTDGDITDKHKGTATKCVGVDELTVLDPAVVCPNRNWELIGALTTDFYAYCMTQKCGKDTSCTTATLEDTKVCRCTLPDKDQYYLAYDAANGSIDTSYLPPACDADTLASHPEDCPTLYQCDEIDPATGDTIGTCDLAQ